MRGFSRILVFLLAACLLLCACDLTGDESSETGGTTAQPTLLTVGVDTVTGAVGETVTVPITVSDGSGLVNADIYLRYDPACLRPVQQYDAEGDVYTLAKAQVWEDALYAAETESGTIRVMLASGTDGLTAGGTLFSVVFEVLSLPDGQALVDLDVPVCGIAEDGKDMDAVAENRLTVHDGKVKK